MPRSTGYLNRLHVRGPRPGGWAAGLLVALWAAALAAGGRPPVVFVSRNLPVLPDPSVRLNAVERADSGRLLVLEPGGSTRVLVDGAANVPAAGAPTDAMDPDVSYDGQRIVFSGYSSAESAYRIYEIDAAGTNLRQVTHSDRQVDLSRYGPAGALFKTYDDLDPCYLPDGRVCFVSTRYPGMAPDGRARATNLYVTGVDGTNLHRITTERFGADTPAVDPATGRIVYSRFWRTAQPKADPSGPPPDPIPPGSPGYGNAVVGDADQVLRSVEPAKFPGVNSWFLAGIDPDGTNLAMYTGDRLDRELTQAYRPSFTGAGGDVLALFIPVTPFYGYPRGNGLRLFHEGPGTPEGLGGPQNFPFLDATAKPP